MENILQSFGEITGRCKMVRFMNPSILHENIPIE